MSRKHLYYAGAAAAAALLIYLLRRSSTPAAPPVVAGTVTSGSQSLTINDNVLSPDFGLPIIVN
jgi:hypothetical protein